jgi:uncharacterized membrane protein (UPF0127 family)
MHRGAAFWPLVGVALLIVGCNSRARLPTIDLMVGGARIEAEVADEDSERIQGLMYRDQLSKDSGMLFVYAASEELMFWMKNTKIPLSVAFINVDSQIVRIADLKPHDLESTSSEQQALYALEMRRGWFDEHGVTEGARVEGLPGPSER